MSNPVSSLAIGLVGGLVSAAAFSAYFNATPDTSRLDALQKQLSAYEQEIGTLKQQVAAQASAVATATATATAAANAPAQQTAAVSSEAIRDYLVSNPDVIFMDALEVFQANEPVYTARRFSKLLDGGLREPLYNNASDPVMGNPEGDVVLVEFFDYNCGYCKSAAPGLFETVAADGNIKLVMKEFPILSAASQTAAKAALASQKQGKYEEYHTALIKFQGRVTDAVVFKVAEDVGLDVAQLKQDMESSLILEKLAQTSMLADQLGVTGTPAFMVGNTFMPGAVPPAQIQNAITLARAQANNS